MIRKSTTHPALQLWHRASSQPSCKTALGLGSSGQPGKGDPSPLRLESKEALARRCWRGLDVFHTSSSDQAVKGCLPPHSHPPATSDRPLRSRRGQQAASNSRRGGQLAGHRKTRTQLDPTKWLKAAPGDSVASVFGQNGSLLKEGWPSRRATRSVHPRLLFPSSGTSWAEPGKREPSQGPGTLSERRVGLPLLTLPQWCLPKTLGCEIHRLSRSWGKPSRNASSSLEKCRRRSSQASPSPQISLTLGYNSWSPPQSPGAQLVFKAFPCS